MAEVSQRSRRLDQLNWRNPDAYRSLELAERHVFAWEWLRRTPAYQEAWLDREREAQSPSSGKTGAARFGLIEFANPGGDFERVRPLWCAECDPSVVVADIVDACPTAGNGIDLLAVASLVTLAVDENDNEHLLLSDGKFSVRVDINGGTLLGAPSLLSYRTSGIARLEAPIATLKRLVAIVLDGRLANSELQKERRAHRWILELRVADALAAGASYREIAGALYGSLVDDGVWRTGSASIRMRVRRLARTARLRLKDGAHFDWLRPRRN